MIYLIVALVLAALDQLVKHLVKLNIPLGGRLEFIPGLAGLTHIENRGAAFSVLTGQRWLFIVVTSIFIVFVCVALLRKTIKQRAGNWAMAVVLGGAIGNYIDRLLHGYVVDMFELEFMNFAIFNVADIFVVCGGIAACVFFVFFYEEEKKEVRDLEDRADDSQS